VTRAHSHRSVGAPPNVRRGDAREIARASRASRAVAARAARKFARRNYTHRIARSTHLGVHRARRRRAVRARARAAAGDRLARVVAVAVAVRVDAARIARRSTRVRIRAFDRARERARGEHARRDGRREASARSAARAPRPTPYPHARRGGPLSYSSEDSPMCGKNRHARGTRGGSIRLVAISKIFFDVVAVGRSVSRRRRRRGDA